MRPVCVSEKRSDWGTKTQKLAYRCINGEGTYVWEERLRQRRDTGKENYGNLSSRRDDHLFLLIS